MAVYQKLSKIQESVNGLAKDTKAYNYDYVDGNKVLGAIRPMMKELHLLLLPEVVEIKTEKMEYSSWDRQAQKIVTKCEVLATVKMRMNWVDSEDGEVVSQEWGATGQNGFDKGFGSALTYGERYYLLKTFHIPTDKDDVDAIATTRDAELQNYYNLQGTPAAPMNYTPVSDEMYQKFVKASAEGNVTKSGRTALQSWQSLTHPDAAAIAKFNADVESYKIKNDLV